MKFVSTVFAGLAAMMMLVSSSSYAGELTPEKLAGTTLVSAEDVIDLVGQHADMVIIDARKNSDRLKGYIEGSVGLPNTETNATSLAKHVTSKSTPVVFYCNGVKCGRSVKSAKIALAEGYSKVYWFRGGWDEWTGKGMPVTKD